MRRLLTVSAVVVLLGLAPVWTALGQEAETLTPEERAAEAAAEADARAAVAEAEAMVEDARGLVTMRQADVAVREAEIEACAAELALQDKIVARLEALVERKVAEYQQLEQAQGKRAMVKAQGRKAGAMVAGAQAALAAARGEPHVGAKQPGGRDDG